VVDLFEKLPAANDYYRVLAWIVVGALVFLVVINLLKEPGYYDLEVPWAARPKTVDAWNPATRRVWRSGSRENVRDAL
jgi:hypothetical protein